MRLIDADALFEVIKKSMAENPHKEKTQRAMHIHEHKYFLTLLTTFPTIQPEERTEKRTETHACDLISRQAAIDEIVAWLKDRMTDGKNGKPLTDRIKDLPSAQPEAPCYLGSPCEYQNPDAEIAQLSQEGTTKGTTFSCSHENDTISRQAAIDALDFEIVHMTAYCDGKNEGNPLAQYNKGLEDGKKAIEALPSALIR